MGPTKRHRHAADLDPTALQRFGSLIEAKDEEEEASSIAIAIREAIEQPRQDRAAGYA